MDLEQITRDIFRIPVNDPEAVSVTVDGTPYRVVNMGSHGIGIALDSPDLFVADDTPHRVELRLEGKLYVLEGRIVHISPHEPDYLCGIHLIDLTDESRAAIMAFLKKIRADMFSN